jgi:hypothetical protein
VPIAQLGLPAADVPGSPYLKADQRAHPLH